MQCDYFEEIGGNNFLVSIIVITYNSAKFVLETLESAKAQSYQNIELIVTDDGSTDETVEICRQWIIKYKDRFVRTELITVEENTGIPANCNRGVRAALGEWVKLIAGDDILLPDAIGNVVRFVQQNNEIQIFDSKGLINNQDLSKELGEFNYSKSNFFDENVSAIKQLGLFVRNLNNKRLLSTCGVYFNRNIFDKVGGFDTTYRLLEDGPFFYRILKHGIKFHYLNKRTFIYRRHEEALSFKQKNSDLIVSKFRFTTEQFIWDKFFAEVPLVYKMDILWIRAFVKLSILSGNSSSLMRMIFSFVNKLRPIKLLKIKRMFNK